MSGPDEILDAIDHALLDYTVSGDAMRWQADVPEDTKDERVSQNEVDRLLQRIRSSAIDAISAVPLVNVPPQREPILHPPIEGQCRHLFMGGPIDGDVMPVPTNDASSWVVWRSSSTDDLMSASGYIGAMGETVTYHAQRFYRLNLVTFEPVSSFIAYVHGSPSSLHIDRLIRHWAAREWQPEDETPIDPPSYRIDPPDPFEGLSHGDIG